MEILFTYLFCRFDFYLILFRSEAIRQFHWKIPFTLLGNRLCLSSWPSLRRPHFKVKCSTTFLTEPEAIGMFYRYPKLSVPHKIIPSKKNLGQHRYLENNKKEMIVINHLKDHCTTIFVTLFLHRIFTFVLLQNDKDRRHTFASLALRKRYSYLADPASSESYIFFILETSAWHNYTVKASHIHRHIWRNSYLISHHFQKQNCQYVMSMYISHKQLHLFACFFAFFICCLLFLHCLTFYMICYHIVYCLLCFWINISFVLLLSIVLFSKELACFIDSSYNCSL